MHDREKTQISAGVPSEEQTQHTVDLVDWLLAGFLALAAMLAAWLVTDLQQHIALLMNVKADDVWFEADVMRVTGNMTDRFSDHFRSQVHPLFSLLALCITHVVQVVTGVGKLASVRLSIALMAGVWLALVYFVLRLLDCRRVDSLVFTLVAASSAAAMFWVAVPESYLWGSTTILAVLAVSAIGERRAIAQWVDTGMAAMALSILITNWMVALFSLTTRHRIKVAVQIAANGLVLVVLLWAVQKFLCPSAHFFMGDREKWPHVNAVSVPPIFFFDSMVMPGIQSIANDHASLWDKLSVQDSLWRHPSRLGAVAFTAWAVLLTIGGWALMTLETLQRFRLVLALSLLGQLFLHMVYGNESFLYALNWVPLLVCMVALTTRTRLRWFSLATAMVFAVSAGLHNWAALNTALQLLAVHAP